jgi:phosphotransferase system enzyme I (PtsI)
MARAELNGIAAARGMALGRARVVYPLHFEVESEPLAPREAGDETTRLVNAIAAARAELHLLRMRLKGPLARDLGDFIDAHALILDDPEFAEGVVERIRRGHLRATAALKAHRDRLAAAFDAIDDPYLRSRREDLDQVVGRVFAALMRGDAPRPPARGEPASILVCESLGPAELDHAHEHGALGAVLGGGSAFSHGAILARSLRLPMVCGVADAFARIRDGDMVLVDGDSGRVTVAPDALDLARLREHQRAASRAARARTRLKGQQTRTRDGVPIKLWANAEQVADIVAARRLGADGVGLFRTEFLYTRHTVLPEEDEQFRAYRDAVLAMGGKPVTLRTLDLGADKAIGTALELGTEPNPALGLRGVRLSLARRALFVAQLRAMLRASAYGPVRILLPMVGSIEEVRLVQGLLAQSREALEMSRVALAEEVELGAMIEVPAAALVSAEIAREVDFLAIGSNDLVQYALAADRNNAAVSASYDPVHPALLRLLALIVGNAKRARKPLTVCGEIAGDVRFAPALLALGVTELSMHPGSLLEMRETLLGLDHKRLRARAARLLRATDRAEVESLVADLVA